MKKSKSGVVIYKGKWIDMYQFRNFRIANKLSNPSDVTPKNVKRFLTKREQDGACGLCGSSKSKNSGLCLRGCVEKTPRQ